MKLTPHFTNEKCEELLHSGLTLLYLIYVIANLNDMGMGSV